MLKKLLAGLTLALGLVSPAAAEQFVSAGSIGTAADGTTGSTIALTTTATVEAGNLMVCVVGKDESGAGTTDGSGNAQFTSAVDTASNTWTEAGEDCNMQSSSSQDGACVAVYYSQAATQLDSGGTITLTGTSVDRYVMSCWEYVVPSGATVAVASGGNNFEAPDATNDPGSLQGFSVGTGSEANSGVTTLTIRATAEEENTFVWTADSDYTAFTESISSSGVAATSMAVGGEWRIATEAVAAASNPTTSGQGDNVSLMVSFRAPSPVAGSLVYRGAVGENSRTTAGTTLAITTSAAASAGRLVVCAIGKDEIDTGTSNGDFGDVTGITDSGSNTWTKAVEFCNVRDANAATGACVDIWYSELTTQIAASGTITAAFGSTTAVAMQCGQWGSLGSREAVSHGTTSEATTAAEPGALSVVTGRSAEYLFVRATGCESNSAAGWTADSDYVSTLELSTIANTGTSGTSQALAMEWRIATEATSATNDNAFGSLDCASAMVGISDAPGGSRPITSMGQ